MEEGQAVTQEPHDLEDWENMKRLGQRGDTVQKDNSAQVKMRAASANGGLTGWKV